jgi:hypothetical protein
MVLATLLTLLAHGQAIPAPDSASNAPVTITHITADGVAQDDPANLSVLFAPALNIADHVYVQTTANKTSQIAGGYRWQVHVEVKIEQAPPVAASEFSFKVPVVLQYERLDGVDAVRAASVGIGRKFTQEWLQLNP